MVEQKMKMDSTKLDTKEFELPETVFVRDIENRVFQGIVLQCLSLIDGISLVEGNFIDNILGRGSLETGVKGITTDQDNKSHSISIKIEINICYGFSIPEKAEEIQTKVTEEITKLTGLHVSCVHVIFKNIVSQDMNIKSSGILSSATGQPVDFGFDVEEEYTDKF